MEQTIFIIGTGGHSKVVTEIIEQCAQWKIIAFVDDYSSNSKHQDKPIFRNIDEARSSFPETQHAFVAIGANGPRSKWHRTLHEKGLNVPFIAHQTATISKTATIGAGTVLCANSIIGPDTRIKEGVIINSAAIIDHDCYIGEFSHIAQGSIACGGVKIGSNVLIGAGSVMEKLTEIPNDSHVDALSRISTTCQ